MFLDSRDPRIIAKAAIAHGDKDGSAPYIRKLEALCTQLASELATMQANDATPHRGSFHYTASLGDATVLLEYDYHPGEEPVYDVESPVCGPGHGPEVEIFGVYINGQWTDPRDCILPATLDRWETEIIEARLED